MHPALSLTASQPAAPRAAAGVARDGDAAISADFAGLLALGLEAAAPVLVGSETAAPEAVAPAAGKSGGKSGGKTLPGALPGALPDALPEPAVDDGEGEADTAPFPAQGTADDAEMPQAAAADAPCADMVVALPPLPLVQAVPVREFALLGASAREAPLRRAPAAAVAPSQTAFALIVPAPAHPVPLDAATAEPARAETSVPPVVAQPQARASSGRLAIPAAQPLKIAAASPTGSVAPSPAPPPPGEASPTLAPRAMSPREGVASDSRHAAPAAHTPEPAPVRSVAAAPLVIAPADRTDQPAPAATSSALQATHPVSPASGRQASTVLPASAAATLSEPGPASSDPDPAATPARPVAAADLQPLLASREAPPAVPAATVPIQHSGPPRPAAHDFATLIDRLVEAREAAAPHVVRATLAHGDFGPVALAFRADDGRLTVQMASTDPAFAPAAVQAAAAAGQSSGNGDNPASSQRHDPQAAPHQPTSGAAQEQAQGQTGGTPRDVRSRDALPTYPADPPASGEEPHGDGIYA